MELHSYAKRKAAKKWSIEHKRKLVDTRIQNDSLFYNRPLAHVLSWRRILSLAKLDEYNVFFVRKQWSNMLAKYIQYKKNRLDQLSPTASAKEVIKELTNEWEFFEPLHSFMTRKTHNNLHSYALTMEGIQIPPNYLKSSAGSINNQPNNGTGSSPTSLAVSVFQSNELAEQPHFECSSSDRIHVFSSDTNEDYAIETTITHDDLHMDSVDYNLQEQLQQQQQKQQFHYFADASEEDTSMLMALGTEEPVKELIIKTEVPSTTSNGNKNNSSVNVETSCCAINTTSTHHHHQHGSTKVKHKCGADSQQLQQEQQLTSSTTSAIDEKPSTSKQIQSTRLSERDKYYRHKRRFNRRIEQRFDSLLNVFGQIVRAEYPSIDVSPLLGTIAQTGQTLAGKVLFSSDDDNDEDDDDDENYNDEELEAERDKNEDLKQKSQH